MTLNLIGLGMNKNSITVEALEILKSCDEVYLENYTVNFPYKIEELESSLNIKLIPLNREKVEDESIIKEAKENEVALLVYGDALSATTHMQLILACKKEKIPYKIFNNASILTSIARTGLSPYKFGKTVSLPNWKEHTNKPTSFVKYFEENLSIGAHTLILTDIGLEFKDAIAQLEVALKGYTPDKIIVLEKAGTDSEKIYYGKYDEIKKKKIQMPFCIIIPTTLNHIEEESLEVLKD
ncbi:MAG: diphthine synthase [archaeon]